LVRQRGILRGMAEIVAVDPPGRPFTERLFASIGWPPFALAGLGVLLAVGGFLLFEGVSGRFALAMRPDAPPHLAQDVRIAIPLLLALVYLPCAYVYGARTARDTWRDLLPALDVSEAEREGMLADAGHYDRSTLRRAGIVGVSVAVLVQLVIDLSPADSFYLPGMHFEALLHRFCGLGLGWWVARTFVSLRVESERLSRAGRERLRVDLLDVGVARPLARHGLRSALLAAIPLSLIGLVALDVEAAPGLGAVLLVGLPLNAVLAVSLLLQPLRGARDAILQAKGLELEWCNDEIRRRREALRQGQSEAPGLADLIAYKEHIASQREWPIDTSTAARFGLALALPLGSWLGGALVERLVDGLLR
jgi:hypothetical protein